MTSTPTTVTRGLSSTLYASPVAPERDGEQGQQRRPPAARRGRSRRAGATCDPCRPGTPVAARATAGRSSRASCRGSGSRARAAAAAPSRASCRRSSSSTRGASEASPKPITWLPESPMNTAARRPGLQVEREKADAGEAEGEREHAAEAVRVLRDGVDCEVRAGDDGERRGEPVHVVEQVEGVRDPDEPDQADHGREHVVSRSPRPSARSRGRSPPRRTGRRASPAGGSSRRSSTRPATKRIVQPAATPSSSELASIAPAATAAASPASSPRKMPTPPKLGVTGRASARPWARRRGGTRARSAGAPR